MSIKLIKDIIRLSMRNGATAAEVHLSQNNSSFILVRLSKVETVNKKIRNNAGLRIFIGKRQATLNTPDFSLASIKKLVFDTIERAKLTEPDKYAGLPDKKQYKKFKGDLKIYSDDVEKLNLGEMIKMAQKGEKAAFSHDKRIKNSEGAEFSKNISQRIYANSIGFFDKLKTSRVSMAVVPIAQKGEEKHYAVWTSTKHSFKEMASPEFIGKKAAEQALKMLGAKKIKTREASIIFDQVTASEFLSDIADAVSGSAIYQKSSFLVGELGKKIGPSYLNIIDDGRMIGGLASSPFDDEGIPTQKTTVVENGILKSYLLDTYSARRLKMKSTGNAYGGGSTNFYLEPGIYNPEEIIKSTKAGLYVTNLIGHGVNLVNGEYSKGVLGLWIEDGKIKFPVKEITIAGNLSDMLLNIEMVGNDLEFLGPIASPSIKISKMVISGK